MIGAWVPVEGFCAVELFREFEPVSIKMAKAKTCPLTRRKFGICGRLMCCLKYGRIITKKHGKMPKVNKEVITL